MKKVILGLACFILLAAGAAAATAVDMSGTWKGTTYIADRDAYDELTFVLKKEGASYSGTITDSLGMAQEAPITNVQLEAEELSFDFTIFDGQEYLTVRAKAKIQEKKLVGKWEVVGSDSSGEFSLERQPEKKSNPRLPGLKAGAWSGLTLSRASCPRLERWGLALANG